MQRLRRAARSPNGGTASEIGELLLELLETVLAGRDDGAPDPPPDAAPSPWVRRLYERIHEEFRDRPPIVELAADAGVHPDHVCRAFRRHFGFTISDLVRHRRVEHAARMIRTTDRPLSSVAYHAGFSDQSHMTRQMKRHLGVTPRELREPDRL